MYISYIPQFSISGHGFGYLQNTTQNFEVSDDQLPVSCPSELALEEICRSEGDDTDDMDTDNVSWLWLINDHKQTERTVYWQQAGFPTETRQDGLCILSDRSNRKIHKTQSDWI